MNDERVKELAGKFEVSEGVISTLYAEAKQDLEQAAAQVTEKAAQLRADMLQKADEEMKSGNVRGSIELRRKAHGVQTRN